MRGESRYQQMAGRVRVSFSTRSLYAIIQQREGDDILIPDHQREYCWTESRKDKFVQSILRGFPCPAILLGEHRTEKPTLEDGNQRITTAIKYRKDEFASNGKLFSQLSVREQDWFDNYPISIVSYANATQEDRIQIFDWHQNGAPLTTGERYHAHSATPLVKYVKDTLFTPGMGLHDRAVAIWGARSGTDKRRRWLQDAVGLVVGLAHGALHMTKKYEHVSQFLTKQFDAEGVTRDLQRILEIFERTDAVQRVQGWTARNWDAGNFVGYIAYSLSHKARVAHEQAQLALPAADRVVFDDVEARVYSPNTLAQDPAEWDRLRTGWVGYMCKVRRDISRSFKEVLRKEIHKDLNNGRNWGLGRWRNGYMRVLEASGPLVPDPAAEDTSDYESD